MSKPITVTDTSFEAEVLNASKPVLVDFWAEWCGPCHSLAPTLEAIAAEYGDKLTVAKHNVDENPGVAQRYQVMSLPTMVLFVDGTEKRRLIGNMPKRILLTELNEYIA